MKTDIFKNLIIFINIFWLITFIFWIVFAILDMQNQMWTALIFMWIFLIIRTITYKLDKKYNKNIE